MAEAFPDAGPLAKYHAGIKIHVNGDIDVTYNGVTKRIFRHPSNNRESP